MTSPVRIEGEFWTSWKSQCLADGLGVELETAVGRIARLWSYASAKEVYAVPPGAIRTYLKSPRAVEVLVEADLGEYMGDGLVRLKGSRRFESLWRYRESRVAGGQTRSEAPRTSGRFRSGHCEPPASPPAHDQHTTTLPPPNDQHSYSGSGSSSYSPDPLSGGQREAKPKRADRLKLMPEDWSPNDTHRSIAAERGLNLAAIEADFRDWAKSKGSKYIDWDAAFRKWLRNQRAGSKPGNSTRDLLDWQTTRIREAEERERNSR